MASAIENDTIQSQGYGTVQKWPYSRIAAGDWGGVQFLSPYLCEMFSELTRGNLFEHSSLGDVAEVGPDGRGIRGNFVRSSMPSKEGMSALWYHKTEVTQTMAAKTDSHITSKKGRDKAAQRLWNQRGRLMLPARVRLNTVRMLSVKLSERALGSGWVPCKPEVSKLKPDLLEKSLCAYFNSSVGILAMLGNRSNKELSYPQFSMDDLRKVAVPNFVSIGKSSAESITKVYDALSEQALLPLPHMDSCDTRRALDDAICSALGIDEESVSMIRRSLAAEPAVTGKRYELLQK